MELYYLVEMAVEGEDWKGSRCHFVVFDTGFRAAYEVKLWFVVFIDSSLSISARSNSATRGNEAATTLFILAIPFDISFERFTNADKKVK